jgi:hypothetical protein
LKTATCGRTFFGWSRQGCCLERVLDGESIYGGVFINAGVAFAAI